MTTQVQTNTPFQIIGMEVAGCVEIQGDDGRMYVERVQDIDEKPQFFSVYAQGLDGLWVCLEDEDDLEQAQSVAKRIAHEAGYFGPIRGIN